MDRIINLLIVVAVVAGCSSKSTDGDADTTTADTAVDTVVDGVDAEDTATDPLDDPGSDTTADPLEDPGEDPDLDSIEDPGEDPAVDAEQEDVADEDVSAACTPLDVTGGDTSAWAICFMGTGTHAVFTLDYDNPLACDITSVQVTGGTLNLASDDSVIFTFSGLTPTTSFSGTVTASTGISVDYHANDGMDGASYDGQDVYIEASVGWDGGSTTVKTTSSALTCVY